MTESTPDPTPAAPPPPAPPVEAPRGGRRRAAEDQTEDQAEDQAPSFARGDLVGYRHPDPITGQMLEGHGIVLWAPDGEGALFVSPLSRQYLEVEPSNLVLASLEDDVDDDDDTAGV